MKVGTNFVPEYLHNDHLGTLRAATNTAGTLAGGDLYTAFGERLSGNMDRYGYVGAWGYESTIDSTTGTEVFPYAHVGARYYDPTSGRFLQRDPIGIKGGGNVYAYVRSGPTWKIDPQGLFSVESGTVGGVGGGVATVIIAALTCNPFTWPAGLAAGAVGAAAGFAVSGYEDGDLSDLWDSVRPLPPPNTTPLPPGVPPRPQWWPTWPRG